MRALIFSGLFLLAQVTTFSEGVEITSHPETDVPILNLPWGKYQGYPFADDDNIIFFENVRFGAKPLLFGAPESPSWKNSSVQPPSKGRDCIQINITQIAMPPGGGDPVADPGDSNTKTGEDCLFLDLYVPKAVLDAPKGTLAPVTVWLYGGAYAFGSKNQLGALYTGQSFLKASKYQTIFVAGNYRVGAYGWLAGHYMQNTETTQTNAGLYDQALLFEWVQTYINQVNGDKDQVSAYGESAGASSILHHLIREGGTVDPTFRRFGVQSPAFEWSWDNSENGKLDQIYKSFSNFAGCGQDFNIDCLRKSTNLSDANQALFNDVAKTGLFPVGPAVDDGWIKTIPTISFAKGQFWKAYNNFLELFLPGRKLEVVRKQISQQYNCTELFAGDYTACIATTIRDVSFTCNTRDLYSAYPIVSYMMQYGFPLGMLAYHATDLVALVSNSVDQAVELLIKKLPPYFAKIYAKSLINTGIAAAYQTYFAALALSGDPNALDLPLVAGAQPPKWPIADGSSDILTKVLTVQLPSNQPGFFLASDNQNGKTRCEFWTKLAESIISPDGLLMQDPDVYTEL
ncbi:carboxylesterase family [Fusarium acutatum]|uniref:Carboxylesterase family n=1 Tax=Fusarium acutatum TaxID=78861 RepID=A0A8H4J8T6_9HYPO|nr:carboxylesterase family [Fusarium acutatum]